MSCHRGSRDAEGGTVTLLIIGFGVVLLLLVTVVVDASAAFLARRGLSSWADGAALAAAQAVSETRLYRDGLAGSEVLPVGESAAAAAVADYLERQAPPELRVTLDGVAVRPDGSVVIRVTAPLRLPLSGPVTDGLGPLRIHANAAARVELVR